jgi:hypothetical protein
MVLAIFPLAPRTRVMPRNRSPVANDCCYCDDFLATETSRCHIINSLLSLGYFRRSAEYYAVEFKSHLVVNESTGLTHRTSAFQMGVELTRSVDLLSIRQEIVF